MAEAAQDVETLKRRGRRRLVGAMALVLAAVIVLPMVFDPEPKRPEVAVNVRIPGESETTFAPKVTPKAPEQKAAVEEKKPEARPEEKKAASAEFTVQVGVFNNPNSATAKLSAAGVPYYTEPRGNLTRVLAGPFSSREAAEKAIKQLKSIGLDARTVIQKTG
jgi:DedD protein